MSNNNSKNRNGFWKRILWVLYQIGLALLLLLNDVITEAVGGALQAWLGVDDFPSAVAIGLVVLWLIVVVVLAVLKVESTE